MKIKLKWKGGEGEYNTKTMQLICMPARGKRTFSVDEIDADLCSEDGKNICIANVYVGDGKDSKALCEEICRRFNEFPQDLKQ